MQKINKSFIMQSNQQLCMNIAYCLLCSWLNVQLKDYCSAIDNVTCCQSQDTQYPAYIINFVKMIFKFFLFQNFEKLCYAYKFNKYYMKCSRFSEKIFVLYKTICLLFFMILCLIYKKQIIADYDSPCVSFLFRYTKKHFLVITKSFLAVLKPFLSIMRFARQ